MYAVCMYLLTTFNGDVELGSARNKNNTFMYVHKLRMAVY